MAGNSHTLGKPRACGCFFCTCVCTTSTITADADFARTLFRPFFFVRNQIITVLVPLVIGKVVRETVAGAKPWVKRFKVRLSLTSSAMLIMVVWQTLSRAQSTLTSVPFEQILSVIAAGIGLHFV